MLGALAASGLAGRFGPLWRVPAKSFAAAVIGGLLLGYGARLASGCNIGAFFSGVASASLHGWVWFIAAFIGTTVGTRLRPAVRADRRVDCGPCGRVGSVSLASTRPVFRAACLSRRRRWATVSSSSESRKVIR